MRRMTGDSHAAGDFNSDTLDDPEHGKEVGLLATNVGAQVKESILEEDDSNPFQGLKYEPQVDGLRAVAVVAVILFHFNFEWCSGGYAGVDVFFVISGYVISRIIYHDMASSQLSVLRFWDRRVHRLQPALLLVTSIAVIVLKVFFEEEVFRANSAEAVYVLASAANFKFYTFSSYFESPEDHMFLHCWSLAVEEQFYFVYPSACAAMWTLARQVTSQLRVVAAIFQVVWMVAAATSLWMCIATADIAANFGYYMLPARAWQMLLGALVALPWLLQPWTSHLISFGNVLQFVGLLSMAASFVVYDSITPYPSYFALLPCTGAALVILGQRLAGEQQHSLLASWLLANPVSLWLGKISYSLYLWHWPVYVVLHDKVLMPDLSPERTVVYKVAGMMCAVLLAALTYRCVESVLRQPTAVPPKVFWPVLLAIWLGLLVYLMLASAGLSVDTDGGFGDVGDVVYATEIRVPVAASTNAVIGQTKRTWATCWNMSTRTEEEEAGAWTAVTYNSLKQNRPANIIKYCFYCWDAGSHSTKTVKGLHNKDPYPTIAFIGNSHCLHHLPHVTKLANKFDAHVGMLCTTADFIHISGFEKEGQFRGYDTARVKLLAEWKPDVIVWADAWSTYSTLNLESHEKIQSWRQEELPEFFEHSINLLLGYTKKLLILGDTPKLDLEGYPNFLKFLEAGYAKHQNLTFLRDVKELRDSAMFKQQQEVEGLIQSTMSKLNLPQVEFVPIRPYFTYTAANQMKLRVVDPTLQAYLFRDMGHLASAGAQQLAPLYAVHVFGQSACNE